MAPPVVFFVVLPRLGGVLWRVLCRGGGDQSFFRSTPVLGSTYILFRTRGRGGQRRGRFGNVCVGGIIFVKNWEGGWVVAGLGWLMGSAFVVGAVQREGLG